MVELYKGIEGSPITYLVDNISDSQTTINIGDDTALPDAPNIATIGYGEDIETIRYGAKSNGVLQDVTRGIEGAPRAWPSGTEVARFFTAYDHLALIEKITENADNHAAHLAEFETHQTDFTLLKSETTAKLYSADKNENITITLPGRGNYLCALGHGIAGQSNAGALYLVSYWTDTVRGVTPIVDNSRFTVTLSSDRTLSISRTSGWMIVSLTKLS